MSWFIRILLTFPFLFFGFAYGFIRSAFKSGVLWSEQVMKEMP